MYKEIAHEMSKSPNNRGKEFLDIGGILLGFMKEKKIDRPAELSRLSGVSESEVYNVLKNRRSRSGLKTLQRLVTPLGKNLADIFNKLVEENEGNVKKLEKDPFFAMEFKKQGITIFSDIPPLPELFIGRISLLGGTKGFASEKLRESCLIFLRVVKGALDVEYGGKIYFLSTYQKLIFDGRYKHSIKNKSGTEPAEALMVTAPSFWVVTSP